MTREFTLERTTKNMYRYQEEGIPAGENTLLSGTVYIFKAALPTKPQRIRVTVEPVEVAT